MVDRLVLELEPRLELLHGDAKAASLLRALSEAKSYASEDQVVYNKPLSYRVLRNHVQALERELNSDSEFQKLLAGFGSALLGIGSNERTKIVIKLRSSDSCPAYLPEMARSIWMNATAHKDGCR